MTKNTNKFYNKIFMFANIAIFVMCFVVVLVVDMFVKYSSGDDVAHRILAEKHNLWEFIKNCETSRISKKISLYYIMRSNIMVWRVLNAFVFTLLIGAISKIIFVVKQVSDIRVQFYIRFIVLVSMCFAHISVIGFTVFWVTGTQDYLWPLTFGMISLIPDIQCTYGKPMSLSLFLGAVFCAVWGGLGQEQISFLLICIAFLNYICQRINGIAKKDRLYSFFLLLIRAACFCFLFLAPMNQDRLAAGQYYTDFHNLTALEHLFITVQWELSAFANELKLLFVSVWVILGLKYFASGNSKKFFVICVLVVMTIPSFLGIPFLNDVGISTITEMGIRVEDIVRATDRTVSFDTMSIANWCSFGWWMISAMIITSYLLKSGGKNLCFAYVLGLVLPLMQIVSSSMYVSGGRAFWMSAVLFSGVIGMLLAEKFVESKLALAGVAAVVFALYEIGVDAVYYMNNMACG